MLTIEREVVAKLPAGALVAVKAIRIIGNKRISTEILQALVADAIGQSLTLSQLDERAERITDYYYSQGLRRARAIIPVQTFESGLVKFQIVLSRHGSNLATGNIKQPLREVRPPAAEGAKTPVADKPQAEAPLKTTSPRQMAQFHYRKALTLLQEGRAAETQENLENALTTDPGHASARELLAIILIEAGKPQQAEDLLQKGLTGAQEQNRLAMLLARLKMSQGNLKGALEVLSQSQQYAVDNASYQAMMAAVLQRNGQHEDAIGRYRSALRREPDNAPWLVGLGISLQAANKPSEAADAFARARQTGKLDPVLEAFAKQRLKELNQH